MVKQRAQQQRRHVTSAQQRRELQREELSRRVHRDAQAQAALTSQEATDRKRRLRHLQQEVHERRTEEGILKVWATVKSNADNMNDAHDNGPLCVSICH